MPAGASTNSNQRVTTAVLGVKLDHLTGEVGELRDDVREFIREQRECNENTSRRQAETDRELARVKERQNIITGLQAAFTAISSILAGALGMRR